MLKTIGKLDLLRRNNDNKIVGGGNRNLSKSKISKNAKTGTQVRIEATKKPTLLIPDARKAFNQLRQAFIKAPIL